MVVALGPVSGAHLNPAVTAGLVAARLVPLRQGLWDVLAQVVGAFLALGFGALVGRELPVPDPHTPCGLNSWAPPCWSSWFRGS
ncbi:aquaporin [Deinococcus rufus]|uniref:Aquaporin n=1 Tax=Deinococcus rufus TaxID=2136097 RepID=A0ABV7ZAW0_9DEIO